MYEGYCFISSRGKRLSLHWNLRHGSVAHPVSYIKGWKAVSPIVKWPGYEDGPVPPCSAKVNEWGCSSTLSCTLMDTITLTFICMSSVMQCAGQFFTCSVFDLCINKYDITDSRVLFEASILRVSLLLSMKVISLILCFQDLPQVCIDYCCRKNFLQEECSFWSCEGENIH